MPILEAGLAILLCALALAAPRSKGGWLSRAGRAFARVAVHRRSCVLGVTLTTLALRLALLPILPVPEPFIHDEFANLLAADTFASGRLANPTHPHWIHFESFHISHWPSYMSMYFPAQGLALALGQAVFGHPWFGVWLTAGAMCGAILWMLQGWLPPAWALLGGLLAVLRLGLFSYWMNSYWGGAIAAIGGALVLGAAPRLKPATPAMGVVLACGASLLAASRPYEGFFLCFPVVLYFAGRVAAGHAIKPALTPAMVVLAAAAAFLAYYNWRVFGSPATMPYAVNRSAYAMAPVFVWQEAAAEPGYRHRELRDFYVDRELKQFQQTRGWRGLPHKLGNVAAALFFFVGFAFAPVLFAAPRALRAPKLRLPLFVLLSTGVSQALNVWSFPHYLAPAAPLLYLVLMQCLRHLRLWRFEGRPAGAFLAQALPAACVLLAAARCAAGPLSLTTAPGTVWYETPGRGAERARVLRELESRPGAHLVLVRYSAGHDSFDEWVYNRADIDRAKVVWAREMAPERNRELLSYFRARQIWVVEPDRRPVRIERYAPQSLATRRRP